MNNLKLHLKRVGLFVFTIIIICSCNSIFLPKEQDIVIYTSHEKSSVFLGRESGSSRCLGSGDTIKSTIEKGILYQVTTRRPNSLEEYQVLVPHRLNKAVIPFCLLDLVTFFPLFYDFNYATRFRDYDKKQFFSTQLEKTYREEPQKFIHFNGVYIDFTNLDQDLLFYKTKFKKDLLTTNKKLKDPAQIIKIYTDNISKLDYSDGLFFEDVGSGNSINDLLTEMNFLNTDTSMIYSNEDNSLSIEAHINWLKHYTIKLGNNSGKSYMKVEIGSTWILKNVYNEVLDTIQRVDFSGDLLTPAYTEKSYQEWWKKAINHTLKISFLKMMKTDKMKTHLDNEIDSNQVLEKTEVNKPDNIVRNMKDSPNACVIVLREDGGHGSGFSISNDGFIITNYHVIAGYTAKTRNDVSVKLSNGTILPSKIVKFDKTRDLALLKVDYEFSKSFLISDSLTLDTLQTVFTYGAPRSIELGLSLSKGTIKEEIIGNRSSIIQLNMNVNPGNSGGPCFNSTGLLIGVIQSKLVSEKNKGISFAIPSSLIIESLNLIYQ